MTLLMNAAKTILWRSLKIEKKKKIELRSSETPSLVTSLIRSWIWQYLNVPRTFGSMWRSSDNRRKWSVRMKQYSCYSMGKCVLHIIKVHSHQTKTKMKAKFFLDVWNFFLSSLSLVLWSFSPSQLLSLGLKTGLRLRWCCFAVL